MRKIHLQPISWYSRHQQDIDNIVRLTQARQDLRDECAQPLGDPVHRDNAVINQEMQQVTQDLDA